MSPAKLRGIASEYHSSSQLRDVSETRSRCLTLHHHQARGNTIRQLNHTRLWVIEGAPIPLARQCNCRELMQPTLGRILVNSNYCIRRTDITWFCNTSQASFANNLSLRSMLDMALKWPSLLHARRPYLLLYILRDYFCDAI
jgi:hypothetical protein